MAPRILIAEDNDRIAAPMQALLRRHGMAAERAGDGVEALSRIASEPPDLLLLDLKLPRLHGIDLLKKLRQSPRTRELPVIICTGVYKGDRYAEAARRLGVSAYLEKPFRAEALLGAVRGALPAQQEERATMDRHLLRAFSGRFSGRYLFKGDQERSLLLLDGLPVTLRPGFVHRDFGDYLHRKGAISAVEYAYYRGDGGHRHEALVQMGCLDYPELLQEKLAYLSTELVASFGSPPLAVAETPLAVPPELQLITVNIPQIFYQGYRRHGLAAGKSLLARHGRHYVATTGKFFRHINFLSLSAEERGLLARLDGKRPLTDCLEGEDDLAPLLQTLSALKMVRFGTDPIQAAGAEGFPLRTLFNAAEEEPAAPPDAPLESFADLVEQTAGEAGAASPERPEEPGETPLAGRIRRTHAELQGKNHYQVFGLKQGGFSFDLLKERYFALTRQYGPEVLMQLTGAEAALVEEILDTVSTAYNTLSDVVKKERYDELLGSEKVGLGHEGDDRFQAQVQFQSGQVFIGMQEWESAEKALQDACNIDPNSGSYLAHLAWAIYRNPKNETSRAMREKAGQLLNRALVLERTAPGFAFKGWMLLEGGQEALAEAEFNKALKLDARQPLARKGLRAIGEKREQEKKGLFRRMFR